MSASAAEGHDGAGSATPVVGGFGLGDGVEGLINERVGSFSFGLPASGLGLQWDSRAIGVDQVGFGPGWTLAGLGRIGVTGGLTVFPASGGAYAADASAPSGLAGYVLGDVVFSQTSGVIPARADGQVGDREYAFMLSQTGGTTTYFSATGQPLTHMDAFHNRNDWVWESSGSYRLLRAIDELGMSTGVDWSNPALVAVTRTTGTRSGASSVVELSGGEVTAVVDPTGARVAVGYDTPGRISRISGASGAVTEVSWQTLADGSTAVDRVRVLDGLTGEELSAREWDASSAVASGWPVYAGEADVFASGDSGFHYQTVLSDGATRVISEYNSTHLLTDRSVQVTTPSGPVTLQEQAFGYPGMDGDKVPAPWDLPEQFNRPTTTGVTFRDAAGRQRDASEQYEFDTFGRPVSHTSADGSVTETTYDQTIPAGGVLPIGLPVSETVTTPDGLVSETRHEFNEAHSAALVAETFTGKTGEDLTRTSRAEYTVREDGFVSEERAFGQGGTGDPVVTTHMKDVDLESGTMTVAATVAAGTDLATTTSEVTDLLIGQAVSQTDPVGNTGSADYDAAGRVTAQTDAAGNTSRSTYSTVQADGVNATVVTAPDGVVTTTETDVLGRIVKVTDNLKDGTPTDGFTRVAESRAYPEPGTIEITDAWGAVTVTKQDVFGRESQTVAPTGLTKITRYDDIAHTVTTALTPTGDIADAEYTSTQTLDESGHVSETTGTRSDGEPVPTITSVFDGFGRQTATADETTGMTVQWDVFGNPAVATITPRDATDAPVVAERRFDQFGTSVEKTLSAGNLSRSGGTRTLDVLGQPVTKTDQDGLLSSVQHTVDGLVAKTVTGYGQVTTNTYDPVTRALIETVTTSPIGQQVRTGFEYDPVTGNLLAVFDPADRAGTQISYTYDGFHNITSTTYPDGKRITHTYDPNGRKLTTTDIAGNTTAYTYDTAGLLTTAIQTDVDGTELGRVGYTYDDYARVTDLSRGNGVSTRYTFTSLDQIATETTTGPDGAIQDARTYTYDGRGNLTHRTDTTTPVDGTEATTTTTAYEYDAQDRLTRSTIHEGDAQEGAVVSDTTYALTVSGDVSRESVTALDPDTGVTTTSTRDFAYTPTGEIAAITTTSPDGAGTTATPAYDAAGNLTTAVDGTRYTYNALNRPVTETTPTGGTLSTGYWATGQRANLTTTDPADGDGRAGFYWDDASLVNDTHSQNDSPSGTASYLIGTSRQTRTITRPHAGADTSYYTQDRHGSTTALTGADGSTTTRYTYTDYGTPTSASIGVSGEGVTPQGWVGNPAYQPFQFAGEHSAPSGAQYLQARTYDPGAMRFTTKDTAELHNTYSYADLNPVTMTDPTGRTAGLDAINGVTLGLGIVFAVISIVSALPTMGGSLEAYGLIADAYTIAVSTAILIDENITDIMSDETAAALTATELAISVSVGALGAVMSVTTAISAFRGATSAGRRGEAALLDDVGALRPAVGHPSVQGEGGAPLLDDEATVLTPHTQSPGLRYRRETAFTQAQPTVMRERKVGGGVESRGGGGGDDESFSGSSDESHEYLPPGWEVNTKPLRKGWLRPTVMDPDLQRARRLEIDSLNRGLLSEPSELPSEVPPSPVDIPGVTRARPGAFSQDHSRTVSEILQREVDRQTAGHYARSFNVSEDLEAGRRFSIDMTYWTRPGW
ncbi:RHS repeat-associated core domain-containing protein [Microbacterium rhizomatis]|uniref:RHS repeat protein n=1 Tax=Microbacterium rhizomatis TaxID=1631477 RepID=A0A5J5J0Z4_9MICO|nr:RHS repeat-associated core domain-containing protein [Microbacterium rhizomatis]KAA9108017.1 RHS repeat protein [Microbacterium rhizomatis]